MKKSLKFIPYNGDQDFGLKFPFLLLPLEQSLIFEESDGKRNMVITSNIGRSKMVFALLDEIITVYVGLIFVHIATPSLNDFF